MQSLLRTFLFGLVALVFVENSVAQPQAPRFTHVSKIDGLVGSRVFAIEQDSRGFMWFGTNEGLSRYDGYSFKSYTYNSVDTTSLSNDWIESLLVDEAGLLWIGTRRGLNRYDPASGSFKRFYPGLDTTDIPENYISSLYESSDKSFWIGTQGGLFRFNRKSNTFEAFKHDPNDITSLSYNFVQAIFEDHSGTLWVGTGGPLFSRALGQGGLNRFNPATGLLGAT